MALFKFGKKEDRAEEGPQREFDRVEGDSERIVILSTNTEYELADFSLGGFCLRDYEGNLRGNQYFDFKFVGKKDGEAVEVEGVATVVRVKKQRLAAKYPPQPRLWNFFRDYMN